VQRALAGKDFGGWLLTDMADPESEQAFDQFIAPLAAAVQEQQTKITSLMRASRRQRRAGPRSALPND
jgi:hypothetical protein